MNPYLERYWSSVHTQLIVRATEALNRSLPHDLVARPEERLEIASDDQNEQPNTVIPDSAIFDRSIAQPSGSATIVAPFKLVVDFVPHTEKYIKILSQGDRLITVIEFLSPANKLGKGLKVYRRKRNDLLDRGVHVVEADLVRKGNWRALMRPHVCPVEALADYRAVIRMGRNRGVAYVFPWSIKQRLESIPIPLRSSDAPHMLDVQRLLNDVYEINRYERTINYSESPQPPLTADAAEWTRQLLGQRGIIQP